MGKLTVAILGVLGVCALLPPAPAHAASATGTARARLIRLERPSALVLPAPGEDGEHRIKLAAPAALEEGGLRMRLVIADETHVRSVIEVKGEGASFELNEPADEPVTITAEYYIPG